MLGTFDPEILQYFFDMDLVAGGQIVDELIDLFAQHTPPLLAKLECALTNGDWETAHQIAHRLKGSSASIGGVRLAALCSDIDAALAAHKPQDAETLGQYLGQEYEQLLAALDEQRIHWAKRHRS